MFSTALNLLMYSLAGNRNFARKNYISQPLPPMLFSSPEAALLLVSTKNCDLDLFHSGQTTGHSREHARELSTSGQFPSSSHKIPRSTSPTRAISVLSSMILPLQTFFSRVLLLRQQPFSSKNLPPERPMTTIAIKTQVFMFRYESVNSTRKFTIVAEIVSLLKKIYKRDAPFRAVFKVKTLAVLFSAYPREMKHIPRNLNLPPFCRYLFLWKWCNPFPRARARLKEARKGFNSRWLNRVLSARAPMMRALVMFAR